MDTITLSVAPAGARRIIVKSRRDTNPVDDREGNLDDVAKGATVRWEAPADLTVKEYTVRFFRYGVKKSPVWPFVEVADDPSQLTLSLLPGASKDRTVLDGLEGEKLKYEVAASPTQGKDSIHPLDPMIIMRPPGISKWLFGLVCAVLGAALGAALTYAQLVQCAQCG